MHDPLHDHLPDIINLLAEGWSTSWIVGELDLDIGPRQLACFIEENTTSIYRNPRYDWVPRNVGAPGRQSYDTFGETLLLILHHLFTLQGRDLYTCEYCGRKTEQPCVVHHERYLGATLDDLKLVCVGCNNKAENQGLL